MSKSRRRFFGVLGVLAAVVSTVSSGPAGAAQVPHAAAPADVRWSACHRSFGPFECTTVRVPLDYDEPRGRTISLALIRLPAADPARRIGSLFVNPGGPGGSGIDLVRFAGHFLFPQQVLDRFDLVGFDPRGVGQSTPLHCFATSDQLERTFPPYAFPTSEQEEALWIESDRLFVDGCRRRGGEIAKHMSTANVARDLDRLREALGDDQLTYYGISYGSFLGTTYANLFPARVRAVGLDSAVDPSAWANQSGSDLPLFSRLGSDKSTLETLHEFLRLCEEGSEGCPLAPDAKGRFEALTLRLRQSPITVTGPTGSPVDYGYDDLIGDARVAMYEPFAWPAFADFLAFLEDEAGAAALGSSRKALLQQVERGPETRSRKYPNYFDAFSGVACADGDGPVGYAAWSASADAAEARFGHFGRIWAWISSVCAEWPFGDADRYLGPFSARTSSPVLVVNNRFDPATPYAGAATLANLLPNSSLLTVAGWGHGSLLRSACADTIIADYLVDQVVPAPGTVCVQDFVPFGP